MTEIDIEKISATYDADDQPDTDRRNGNKERHDERKCSSLTHPTLEHSRRKQANSCQCRAKQDLQNRTARKKPISPNHARHFASLYTQRRWITVDFPQDIAAEFESAIANRVRSFGDVYLGVMTIHN